MNHISTVFTLLLASLSALHGADDANADTARHAKLAGLLHNEDCTDFFGYQDCTAEKAGEAVDGYVDVLAGAGVSVQMPRARFYQSLLDSGIVESRAALSRHLGISRARVTQVLKRLDDESDSAI